MSTPLPLHISPQITFMSDVPSASEMINFLILVHVFQFRWSNQASPKAVPCTTFTDSKARYLKGIHHAVIGVCRIINLEGQG